MPVSPPLDSLGRRRSPATVPGYRAGRPPRTKGRHYPAYPPRTEEIIAVMRCCGGGLHGDRARGLIAVLWRAGLRIQEALDLTRPPARLGARPTRYGLPLAAPALSRRLAPVHPGGPERKMIVVSVSAAPARLRSVRKRASSSAVSRQATRNW